MRALVTLSVFPAPFSPEAAAALGVADALPRLRRRSFLARRPDGDLALYDGIRTWARARARADGVWADATRAHARWLATAPDAERRQADLVQAVQEGAGEHLRVLVSALLKSAAYRGPVTRMRDVFEPLLRPTCRRATG
ncbi:MAG: hypothetical protein R3F59_21175 [Myxococcota bacterium]